MNCEDVAYPVSAQGDCHRRKRDFVLRDPTQVEAALYKREQSLKSARILVALTRIGGFDPGHCRSKPFHGPLPVAPTNHPPQAMPSTYSQDVTTVSPWTMALRAKL